jgi:type VI protein secretion system component Hcp
MADDKTNDILMRFVQSNGQSVDGEAQSEVDYTDLLMLDFKDGKFFQVEDFSMGIEVSDEDPGKDNINTAKVGTASAALQPSGPSIKFGRWKSATRAEAKDIKYPVQMDPFSFTRTIDKASLIFFESCVKSYSFKQATMVKRKVTGSAGAKDALITISLGGLSGLSGFLRLDFYDVLITSLQWDDGETIKEKGKFVFRRMTIQYRRQNHKGTLQGISQAEWEHEVELAQPT